MRFGDHPKIKRKNRTADFILVAAGLLSPRKNKHKQTNMGGLACSLECDRIIREVSLKSRLHLHWPVLAVV